MPDDSGEFDDVFERMRNSAITCHGGGTSHSSDVCLDCERYVGCKALADGIEVHCWWYGDAAPPEPRAVHWLEEGALHCASCGAIDEVSPHPRMEIVPICGDCLSRQLEPIDYGELGVGD